MSDRSLDSIVVEGFDKWGGFSGSKGLKVVEVDSRAVGINHAAVQAVSVSPRRRQHRHRRRSISRSRSQSRSRSISRDRPEHRNAAVEIIRTERERGRSSSRTRFRSPPRNKYLLIPINAVRRSSSTPARPRSPDTKVTRTVIQVRSKSRSRSPRRSRSRTRSRSSSSSRSRSGWQIPRLHHRHKSGHAVTISSTRTLVVHRTSQGFYRVREDQITVATLRHFGISWEYNRKHPGWITILHDPSTYDIKALYNHSCSLLVGGSVKVVKHRHHRRSGSVTEISKRRVIYENV